MRILMHTNMALHRMKWSQHACISLQVLQPGKLDLLCLNCIDGASGQQWTVSCAVIYTLTSLAVFYCTKQCCRRSYNSCSYLHVLPMHVFLLVG
jgi:hypothetical protein